jgi:type II secretory pathway component PulC
MCDTRNRAHSFFELSATPQEKIMLKQYTNLAVSLAAVAGVGAALAQPADPAPRPGDDAQYIEVQRARTEMDNARRQLEEAARTIVTHVPNVAGFDSLIVNGNNFTTFGRQSQIGATITDADDGALVTNVTSGGGADQAGLKVGDVIQSIDGIDLNDGADGPSAQLRARLRDVETGDSVNIVAERGGDRVNLDIETQAGSGWFTAFGPDSNELRLFSSGGNGDGAYRVNVAPNADRPNVNVFRALDFAYSPWGDMELVTVTEDLGRYFDTSEGLLVVSAPDDDALDIDIRDGDVILSISGRTPNSPEHAIRILSSFEAGETIELSIMRDRRRATVEYEIPARQNAPVPPPAPVPVLPSLN